MPGKIFLSISKKVIEKFPNEPLFLGLGYSMFIFLLITLGLKVSGIFFIAMGITVILTLLWFFQYHDVHIKITPVNEYKVSNED